MDVLDLRLGQHLPWWAVQLLGFGCVLVGTALTVHPFHSLVVMAWLITTGLVLIGVSKLAAAFASPQTRVDTGVGLGWIVAGLLSALLPGLTVHALTIMVGALLLLSGVVQLRMVARGKGDRLLLGLRGLANSIFGLLALTAPAATVLVLAVSFGLYVVVFGFGQMALAYKLRTTESTTESTTEPLPAQRPWSRPWQLAGTLAAVALALIGLTLSINIRRSQPGAPGPFYAVPSPLPDGPAGTIIRAEVADPHYPGGVIHRVLYKSVGYDGQPTAVSALIIVPHASAPAQGRNVVAYTHGTIGVAPNCALSLALDSLYERPIPGSAAFLANGDVVVATDYQGLGTQGPHPYLVGASEGANALDAVRAAINLPAANAGRDFVVWGESQGGHAALFTGQMAASYAPELMLHGVVASAPAGDLRALFQSKTTKPDAVGNLLVAMAINSWAQVYEEARLDQIVLPAARSLVTAIARNCIQNADQLQASIPAATLLNLVFFRGSPLDAEPWRTILSENTPGAVRTDAPILVGQGDADQVIPPATQRQFVGSLCAVGNAVDYRVYPAIGHLTIADDTADEVVQWIADRFAGVAAGSTCE